MADWLADWLAGWMAEWLSDWLNGRLAEWLNDCLAGWRANWLTDWLRGLHQVSSMSSDKCGHGAKNALEVDSEADTESSNHYTKHQISHSIRTILRLSDNEPNLIQRCGSCLVQEPTPWRNIIDLPDNNIDLSSSSSLFFMAMHARKHRCGTFSERRIWLFSLASTQAVTSPSANRTHETDHRQNVAGITCLF